METRVLRPGTILVLPTSAGPRGDLKALLEDANDPKAIDEGSHDVLEGVSTQRPLYWRRVAQEGPGDHRLRSGDGASRIEWVEASEKWDAVRDRVTVGEVPTNATWEVLLRCSLSIGTATFRFEYLKPKRRVQRRFLGEHLKRAAEAAGRIAVAVGPGNEFLRHLLVEAARMHDGGKGHPKWQRAMGNTDMTGPVAKPLLERPSALAGFRHEWESLLKMRDYTPSVPDSLSESDLQYWMDLWRHLVVSHHGHLRPWLADRSLEATQTVGKQRQSALRLESAERFARLQHLLGPWRLAYLEALLKATDVAASQASEPEEADEQ